jgi:inward rectifier potassium channel
MTRPGVDRCSAFRAIRTRVEERPLPTDPSVRIQKVRSPGGFDVWLVGVRPQRFGDLYHAFLRISWPKALGVLAIAYLFLNLVFAVAFAMVGGVVNARPGSFRDAFAFSIQTMGTIGYGAMYPQSMAAEGLVGLESVVALIFTALVTGLVFARFTRIMSRVLFTTDAVIGPVDGVPTLSFRVGNDRDNSVLDATLEVTLTRLEVTREGTSFYRSYDLALVRPKNNLLSRSWSAMHRIDEKSALFGTTPESNEANEVEINVFLRGVDETTHQPIYAHHRYESTHILYEHRHKDILSIAPDGLLTLDQRDFDRVEQLSS